MSSEAKLQEINGTKRNFAMDLQVLHLTGVCDFKTQKKNAQGEIPKKKNACCPLFVYYKFEHFVQVQAPEHDISEFYLQNPPQHSSQRDEWLQHKENLLLGRHARKRFIVWMDEWNSSSKVCLNYELCITRSRIPHDPSRTCYQESKISTDLTSSGSIVPDPNSPIALARPESHEHRSLQ